MTAEVAILTRSAVALAADSAVTIGRERVWKNTNKLFSVSTYNDIGLMIFDTGDFCGVAWETVIKQFRKHIRRSVFDTVSDCAKSFGEFLNGFDAPGTDIAALNLYMIFLKSIADCKKSAGGGKSLQKRKAFISECDRQISEVQAIPEIFPDLTRESFVSKHSTIIKDFLVTDSGMHVTKSMHSKIMTLCYERTKRQYESAFVTGVVFSGYGEKQILPALEHWTVDGKYGARARLWKERDENLNNPSSPSAIVLPFGQSDIAYLFMEGLQLDYLQFIKQTTQGILDEKSRRLVQDYVPSDEALVESAKQSSDNKILVDRLMDEFKNMRKDVAIKPMLSVVSSLPREELAAMAEALVEITSLRRKIDSRLESVGGPVDVAVISKSDGFIWMKRKNYFSMELNHDFLVRRKRRFEGDEP